MNFKNEYENRICEIDNYIERYIDGLDNIENAIKEGMKYAVLNGGKRLRSILCLETCYAYSGDSSAAIPYAMAIEFIHAYSLVHDDLPAMDNSDFRRGKPSCHKEFGEDIAILIGDALLNTAFEILIDNSSKTCNGIEAAKVIGRAAGIFGMINGQARDLNIMKKANPTEDDLIKLIEQKTIALIQCSALSGAIIAGGSDEQIDIVKNYSYHLGLAFQIRDDFEDYAEDEKSKHNSPNFINLLGRDAAKSKLEYHINKSLEYLNHINENNFLIELNNFLFPGEQICCNYI